MMMSRRYLSLMIATTLVAGLTVRPLLADPLHKVGRDGAWQHEQSGWVFPKHIGRFARVGAPYEIDGTYDVGARYQSIIDGVLANAAVHIYASGSAAQDGNLISAKAAIHGDSHADTSFRVAGRPELVGTKVSYELSETNPPNAALYFIVSKNWVVNVRMNTDAAAPPHALDAFVNDLPWDTLGTEPGNLH